MPFFRKSDEKKKSRRKSSSSMAEPLPPPPPQQKAGPAHQQRPTSMSVTAQELVFHVQLAHGSPTKKVRDFANVKELYGRIAEAFKMRPNEILFCTLNTHKVDMARLLGGQIGLEDFIFAHVRGNAKEVRLVKSDVSLGLTITDNGAGFAFIKRTKEGSIADNHPDLHVGDHIESVQGRNLVGARHFEVAKMLKELPQHSEFSMKLVEPKKAFDSIAPRSISRSGGQAKAAAVAAVAAAVATENENEKKDIDKDIDAAVGSGKTTLRLRSKGPAVVETDKPWEQKAALKVDDLLESFMGIRDLELSKTLIDSARDKKNIDEFACAVDEGLADFEFPDEFLYDIWGILTDLRPAN
ncbi:PDZ domain-containing protein GIPC2-like [Oscarella lobularis]|uniref:PDZ domain-containing protein GIPC2-like n=1 Tax=Oscarella lobularis TaxID=121494 RepID=UPI003313A173